ncbi:MAG: T9SS type A sorting domain-containing protein [Flavobacteriia bacterium]|nr:T9SS type A sorting domain-containing protein [Flavobacteriia bacterium]
MTDITQSNSNAAIPVMQDSLHEYLYHWKQTITSAGVNQRAGAHFFSDNTALPNRGNSYFVYLREGTNVAQIYEVINDTWTLQAEDTVVVAENVSYDMKVTYDPEGGSIQVYVDNAFIVEWIDPNPLKTANGFSLRSGGCGVRYDEVSVYQSRYNQLDLSIGVDSMIRYQSDNGATAAKVATLVVDYLGNWSTVANEEYRIDWTSPDLVSLNDGISGADIDTIYVPVVSANWNFADLHSGINHYSFAVGTSAATQDILPWTNAGMVNSINHVLQNPVLGTTYYVHVRSENEAGLMSEFVSDGQLLLEEPTSTAGLSENTLFVSVYPQPASETLHVSGNWNNATVELIDLSGRLVRETIVNGKEGTIALQGIASGYYQLVIGSDIGQHSQRILIHQEN